MLIATLSLATTALAAPACAPVEAAVAAALDGHGCATFRLERVRWTHRHDPCLAPALATHGLGPVRPPPPTDPPGSGKEARNAYLPLREFTHETANFVIRWGDDDIDPARAETLGARMEDAWALQIDELGWPMPVGADRYKLNVYIDQTNAGPPDTGSFVAGYYNTDPQGQPMIVIGRDQLGLTTLGSTVQHEFHHAVQNSYGTFEYADHGAWWFEADAVFMEHVADPDDTSHIDNLGAFARRPELTLGFYDAIDEGIPLESYAYGAFVFPRFLELATDDPGVTLDVWERSTEGGNPLKAVEKVMAGHGMAAADWFGEFAARNATWDYPERRDYLAAVRDFDDPDGTWPTGAVAVPTDAPVSPSGSLPATLGANYWEVVDPPASFQLDFTGAGGPATWVVGVVGQFDREQRRVLETVGGAASATVVAEGFDQADEVWLVFAAVDGLKDDGAVFDYQFTLGAVAAGGESTEEPGGCGCRTGRTAGWLAVLPLLVVSRRRARARRTGPGPRRR